ncbi:MAG: hypothetical protein LBL94_00390 [Prevotellaceae bacterium]|jgi:ABC-type Mn2+/Zn2+ transport system permease subunit|nr:hypothetical protein [Prevotellaceae bacterium]
MLEKTSNFSLDVAKIVLGGVVIGSLMKEDIDVSRTALLGAAVVVVFVVFGFTAHYFNKRNKINKL